MSKEARELITDLSHEDPAAFEVVVSFLERLVHDVQIQSAGSMMKHFSEAIIEQEECEEEEPPQAG